MKILKEIGDEYLEITELYGNDDEPVPEDILLLNICASLYQSDCIIISAFPGTGKSTAEDVDMGKIDMDMLGYSTKGFPANYVDDVLKIAKTSKIVLISSHKLVRDELFKRDIPFVFVFPCRHQKVEWMKRFKKNGSSEAIIASLNTNWTTWIKDAEQQQGCYTRELNYNEYISDLLEEVPIRFIDFNIPFNEDSNYNPEDDDEYYEDEEEYDSEGNEDGAEEE